MDLFEINQKTCNQDGVCAAVCPDGLIDFQKGGYPTPTAEAEEVCIRCGHCVTACPTGSLRHRDMSAEQCPPIKKDFQLSAEHCEQFLRSRRSIREYKNKRVPREEISRLIEVARHAPSGHNTQCVEWLVLDNRDELKKLAGVVSDWMRWMVKNKPEIVLPIHMDRIVGRWDEGTDSIFRDAPAVIVAHGEKDSRLAPAACVIALTYLYLAAPGSGFGCCWSGLLTSAATAFPAMIEALALPDDHQCFGAMMIGYPKFGYQRLPLRKPPRITWRP